MQSSFFLDFLVSFEDFLSQSCPQAYLAFQNISSHALGCVRGQHSHKLHFESLRRISYEIYTAEDTSVITVADVEADLTGTLTSHDLNVACRNRCELLDSSSQGNQLGSDQTAEKLAEIRSDCLHASLEVHDQHCAIFVQLHDCLNIFHETLSFRWRQLLMNGRQSYLQRYLLMIAQIGKLSCSLPRILLLHLSSVQALNFPYSLAVKRRVGDDALQFRKLAIKRPLDQSKDGVDLLIDGVGVLIGALDEYILRQRRLVLFFADGAIDDSGENVHVDAKFGVVQQLAFLDGLEVCVQIGVGGGLLVHFLDGVVGLEVVEVVQDVAVQH